jgi:hypothetical protein
LTDQDEASIISHNLRETTDSGEHSNIVNMQHQAFGTYYFYFYLGTMPRGRLLGATEVVDPQ